MQAEYYLGGSAELYILLGNTFYERRPQYMSYAAVHSEPEFHLRAIDCYKRALAVSDPAVTAEERVTALDQLGIVYMEFFQCDDYLGSFT